MKLNFIKIICYVSFIIFTLSSCSWRGRGEGNRKTEVLWATEVPYNSESKDEILEPVIVDINGDGIQEVVVSLPMPQRIYILNGTNGEIIKEFSYLTTDYLTIGDLNKDVEKEIVIMPLKVLRTDGKALWIKTKFQWDETIEYDGTPSTYTFDLIPEKSILIDVNNDGWLDIVTLNNFAEGSPFIYYICAIEGVSGNLLWCTSPEFDYINLDGFKITNRLIAGYTNNEVRIFITGCNINECKIFAIKGLDGTILWSKSTGGFDANIHGLVDFDKDGKSEIIASHDIYNVIQCSRKEEPSTEKLRFSYIDIYSIDGDLLFSYLMPGAIMNTTGILKEKKLDAAMGFGEINGEMVGITPFSKIINPSDDKLPECSGYFAAMITFLIRDGKIISEFTPVIDSSWNYTPVVGDIDGDGKIEVVYHSYPFIQTYNPEDGTPLWWYDIGEIDNFFSLSSGGYFESKPVIGDVDGDGLLEIVAVGHKDVNPDDDITEYKRFVYALKTGAPVPSSPDLLPWPMSYHDPYRTGNYNFVP